MTRHVFKTILSSNGRIPVCGMGGVSSILTSMMRTALYRMPQLDPVIFEGVTLAVCAVFSIGLFFDADPHDEFFLSELEFNALAGPFVVELDPRHVTVNSLLVTSMSGVCAGTPSVMFSPLDQFADACAGFFGLNGDFINILPLAVAGLMGGMDDTTFSEKESLLESDRGVLGNIEGYDAILDTLFGTVVLYNLLGLLPYQFTATSHIAVAFTLSFGIFISINIVGAAVKGLKLFGLFFPKGVPITVGPFLIAIELVSYVARGFSLGIRLFANMLAGHALLKILASFS